MSRFRPPGPHMMWGRLPRMSGPPGSGSRPRQPWGFHSGRGSFPRPHHPGRSYWPGMPGGPRTRPSSRDGVHGPRQAYRKLWGYQGPSLTGREKWLPGFSGQRHLHQQLQRNMNSLAPETSSNAHPTLLSLSRMAMGTFILKAPIRG